MFLAYPWPLYQFHDVQLSYTNYTELGVTSECNTGLLLPNATKIALLNLRTDLIYYHIYAN